MGWPQLNAATFREEVIEDRGGLTCLVRGVYVAPLLVAYAVSFHRDKTAHKENLSYPIMRQLFFVVILANLFYLLDAMLVALATFLGGSTAVAHISFLYFFLMSAYEKYLLGYIFSSNAVGLLLMLLGLQRFVILFLDSEAHYFVTKKVLRPVIFNIWMVELLGTFLDSTNPRSDCTIELLANITVESMAIEIDFFTKARVSLRVGLNIVGTAIFAANIAFLNRGERLQAKKSDLAKKITRQDELVLVCRTFPVLLMIMLRYAVVVAIKFLHLPNVFSIGQQESFLCNQRDLLTHAIPLSYLFGSLTKRLITRKIKVSSAVQGALAFSHQQ